MVEASLTKIATNLENINNTLSKNKIPEKGENDAWHARISPLVEEVQRKCKKTNLTTYRKIPFILTIFFYVVASVALFAELFILLSSYASYIATLESSEEAITFLVSQEAGYVGITVAMIAIIITILSLLLNYQKSTPKDIAEWYFVGDHFNKGLSEGKSEAERPYLKVLIKLRCQDFDINIAHLYQTNPEQFSQEALLRHMFD